MVVCVDEQTTVDTNRKKGKHPDFWVHTLDLALSAWSLHALRRAFVGTHRTP